MRTRLLWWVEALIFLGTLWVFYAQVTAVVQYLENSLGGLLR